MILRFQVRRPFNLTGPKRDSGEGQITFTYRRLQCSMSLVFGWPPPHEQYFTSKEVSKYFKVSQRTILDWIYKGKLPASKPRGKWRIKQSDVEALLDTAESREYSDTEYSDTEYSDTEYSDLVFNLEFTVKEDPPGEILQSCIDTRAYRRLATIMRTIVNRCLRAIRHAGRVPTLHEIPGVEDQEAEFLLDLWQAEVSLDGLDWTPILQESGHLDTRSSIFYAIEWAIETRVLDMRRWADIAEAIRNDRPVLPEQEFTLNAREHLELRNFRLALLESIIGLEIVLTQYLKTYLRIHKKIPQTRVDAFLSPNLTLNTRLSGLLDLTLSPDALQQIKRDRLTKAVKWRNAVVHSTGRLPDGLSNAELREAISAVLELTEQLGDLTQQMTGSLP